MYVGLTILQGSVKPAPYQRGKLSRPKVNPCIVSAPFTLEIYALDTEVYAQFDALIFDMDGTLIDSGPLHEYAWRHALEHYKIPIDNALMRSLAGVPTTKTVATLIKKFSLPLEKSIPAISRLKQQAAKEVMHKFVKSTSLESIVRYFHGKKPMAVGTGADTEEANTILTHCGLIDAIDYVVGADLVEQPKPAPDTFLLCAEKLHVQPTQCVVFEDSELGLQAAKAAKMHAVDVAKELNIHNAYFLDN